MTLASRVRHEILCYRTIEQFLQQFSQFLLHSRSVLRQSYFFVQSFDTFVSLRCRSLQFY